MNAYAGIFDTEDKAKEAVAKLTEEVFTADDVRQIGPASGAELTEAIRAAVKDDFLNGIESRATAELEAGHTVVSVEAVLGSGRDATEILEACGAVKVLVEEAPLWPHLSEAWGLPMLTERRQKGDHLISRKLSPLSSIMPAVISTKDGKKSTFGMPLIKKGTVMGGGVLRNTFITGMIPLVMRSRRG